jgi:hypothetical protein
MEDSVVTLHSSFVTNAPFERCDVLKVNLICVVRLKVSPDVDDRVKRGNQHLLIHEAHEKIDRSFLEVTFRDWLRIRLELACFKEHGHHRIPLPSSHRPGFMSSELTPHLCSHTPLQCCANHTCNLSKTSASQSRTPRRAPGISQIILIHERFPCTSRFASRRLNQQFVSAPIACSNSITLTTSAGPLMMYAPSGIVSSPIRAPPAYDAAS